MNRYGFTIQNGMIFDNHLITYEIRKKCTENNVIFYVEAVPERLYIFEVLLLLYPIDKVFEILKFNKHLIKKREVQEESKKTNFHHITNMAVIYNYPPSYLTQKKFSLYKKCQNLKKELSL